MKKSKQKQNKYLDLICEDCKKKEDSVFHNLILIGFKVCNSCRLSKTIFPIQILFTGITFILLITNDIDKKAIIKKDKKTIPNDLKFDFKLRICLVAIIKAAKIQN